MCFHWLFGRDVDRRIGISFKSSGDIVDFPGLKRQCHQNVYSILRQSACPYTYLFQTGVTSLDFSRSSFPFLLVVSGLENPGTIVSDFSGTLVHVSLVQSVCQLCLSFLGKGVSSVDNVGVDASMVFELPNCGN